MKKKEPKKEEEKKDDKDKMEIEDEYDLIDKTKMETKSLPFNTQYHYGINQQLIQSYAQTEAKVIEAENKIKETSNAKYFLESYIYKTREIVDR